MKTIKSLAYAILVMSIMALIIGMAALGARSIGMVGGWIWMACWGSLGVIGVGAILALGGKDAIREIWKHRRGVDGPDQVTP